MNKPQLSQDPKAIASREFRAKNKEKMREYERRRKEKHGDKRREEAAKRRIENREKINAKQNERHAARTPEQIEETKRKQREYYLAHKEEMNRQSREYRLANKEKLRLYQLEYQRKNRQQITEQQREYIEANPARKIIVSFGSRIRELCKRWSLESKGGFSKYLEADGAVYAKHIESQFVDGMSWENRGVEWEVDHIVPSSLLAMFYGREDLLGEKAINQLCNIRPLKWEENLVKHDNVPDALRIDLSKLIQENPVNPDLMSFVRKWSVLMRDWTPENPLPHT